MPFSLIAGYALSGWLAASSHNPPPAEIQLGKKIYEDRCKVCHGVRGDSDAFAASVLSPPPRNFTAEAAKKELSEKRMILSATEGRPGTAMMPWKNILSEREIRAVVSYIRREFMKMED